MSAEIWCSGPEIDLFLSKPFEGGAEEQLVGIIDTGASGICLDRRIALRLGLSSVNRKPMQMADGTFVPSTAYVARLRVEGLGFDSEVQVWGVEMQYPSTRVLLGRAFLRNYFVNYDGRKELFHYYPNDGSPLNSYEEFEG